MSADTPLPFEQQPLSATEVRILGSLIEKQATTPESYPLTLNALLLACNQKTSREPVMNLASGAVGQALRALEERQLVRLQMASRADRWEQRVDKKLELAPPQLALLGLLLLRGPQTLGELLTRSNRLYAFEDVEQVQHQLERLISRGLALLVPRQSGQREDRYLHLLGSAGDREELIASQRSDAPAASGGNAQYDERLQALEARVAELEEKLALLVGN
ncbi:DUF480 domain-containing protein [Pseudomonas sp. UL073]|uniref:DUF480 domain-containing protein n=1 Tax=Zestomonas insulae TaxID=2809017 RepID=A0ABS2IC74_9GAMM|nr:DUF480 domain-containing protein [Pseudomonas insulae]MBM7060610.1 DUF480 domain-containing protein [Pseudomonas insulae]